MKKYFLALIVLLIMAKKSNTSEGVALLRYQAELLNATLSCPPERPHSVVQCVDFREQPAHCFVPFNCIKEAMVICYPDTKSARQDHQKCCANYPAIDRQSCGFVNSEQHPVIHMFSSALLVDRVAENTEKTIFVCNKKNATAAVATLMYALWLGGDLPLKECSEYAPHYSRLYRFQNDRKPLPKHQNRMRVRKGTRWHR